MTILVHFGAPHGQPHHPSVMKFYEVIKYMHPTHQEASNAPSPILLAYFVQKILILHGPFSWEMWAKATITYHEAKNQFFSKFLGNISVGWIYIHTYAS